MGSLFSSILINPGCRNGGPYDLADCLHRDMAVGRDNAEEHIRIVVFCTFFL